MPIWPHRVVRDSIPSWGCRCNQRPHLDELKIVRLGLDHRSPPLKLVHSADKQSTPHSGGCHKKDSPCHQSDRPPTHVVPPRPPLSSLLSQKSILPINLRNILSNLILNSSIQFELSHHAAPTNPPAELCLSPARKVIPALLATLLAVALRASMPEVT